VPISGIRLSDWLHHKAHNGFEQFLLTNEIIFLVMAGDMGITDILRAEPEDFAHFVVAHAALRRSGTNSPESSHSAASGR
jgi:hypothetical protein